MKRLLFSFFALLAFAGIQSCSRDGGEQGDVTPEEGLQEISFEVGAPELKTTISGGAVTWASSDKLSVFDDEPQFLRQFTNQKGAVSAAVFKGEARLTSQYKVVYPYQAGTTCSGNVVTMGTGLAETQTMPAGGGFATGIPAAGKVNITGKSTLSDLVALLKFTIPAGQTAVKTVRFNGASGAKLSGKFTINYSSNPPVLSAASSGTYSYVTTNTHSTYHTAGTYYLAVFPGTYSGCSVVVNGNDTRTISGSKTFAAGKIYDLGEITYTGSGDTRSLTVTFLPAETSTKVSSGIPWVAPASSTVAYCTNTDAGFATASVTVNGSGKLQFTASSLPKNTKQLWVVYPAQDNSGKNWDSKTLTVPTSQSSNATGDFLLDNYPFAIKVDVGQASTLDFTYSLNGAAGDSREVSNATIVKFDLSNSLYSASGYAEKFTGVTCGGVTTTFSGATQCTATAAYVAMNKAASASYAFSVNNPYQAGYTYPSQTINTSSGNIMSFEPQCTSRIVCVRSGDNIQTRLDACKPQKAYSKVSSNDVMRIAAGTFNLASTIIPRENINVAGGYTATTVAPFTTQGGNQLTIIDGQSTYRCLDMASAFTSSTTWSNMKFQNGNSGLGGGLKINGTFTLSNCYVYNCVSQKYQGGGIYSIGATTITGCTIDNCRVTAGDSGTTTDNRGGGVYISGACTFTNNTVSNCTAATDGGGVFVLNGSGATLSGGSVTGCTASGNGGGVYLWSSSGSISNCTISGNSAAGGGGLFISSGVTATSCTINGNTASGNGGGVSGYGSGKLKNCTVYGNTASGNGGGVYWSADATINANIIEGGTIGGTSLTAGQMNSSTGPGGGVYIAASAVQAKISSATIKNNHTDNQGGGIFAEEKSNATITGCTVDNNEAGGSGYWGGGIYIKTGLCTGTIISNNKAGAGAGIYAYNATLTSLTVYNNTANAAWDDTSTTTKERSSGGGMYINKCTINGNTSVYSNTANGRGGGAYLKGATTWSVGNGQTADIYSNTSNAAYVAGNYQDGGGGLWIGSGVVINGYSASNLMKIHSNTAKGYGGGANVSGSLHFAEVYSNSSRRGAGVLIYNTDRSGINNCKDQEGKVYNSCIRGNAASEHGGGVYMYGSSYMCLNLIIRNTAASTSATGYGVYIYSGSTSINTCPHIINCTIMTNTIKSGVTAHANSAGLYMTNSNDSGVGYLYNCAVRYSTDNKDIYATGKITKGSFYGNHYRIMTLVKSSSIGQHWNLEKTTAAGTLLHSSTNSSTGYLIANQTVFNNNMDTSNAGDSTSPGYSGNAVSTYFPISKDYYGTSISGTIKTAGCEVKFKTP